MAGALHAGGPGAPAAGGAAAGTTTTAAAAAAANPKDTLSPITTTASVLALTYKDGVLMVADTTGTLGFRVRV